jgi:hypothetical protein
MRWEPKFRVGTAYPQTPPPTLAFLELTYICPLEFVEDV